MQMRMIVKSICANYFNHVARCGLIDRHPRTNKPTMTAPSSENPRHNAAAATHCEPCQSLDTLQPREARYIECVLGDNPELKRRLYALGFVPGAKITTLRVAPLGDPMQVRVGGSSVSIRRREASAIQLQPAQTG